MSELFLPGTWEQLPERLTVQQVARMLNTTDEGVYVITARKLLKPLGNPPRNGTKYYAKAQVRRSCADDGWLGRISAALVKFKWDKNHAKEKAAGD